MMKTGVLTLLVGGYVNQAVMTMDGKHFKIPVAISASDVKIQANCRNVSIGKTSKDTPSECRKKICPD